MEITCVTASGPNKGACEPASSESIEYFLIEDWIYS